ncbi:MAG: bifunctional phosphopantothenoylcysteine decarboxylase/phosphopantothenate--cysteine ligase CoaBC [Candidatus Bathyarchaeota archaeon]|nr:MAG: bifunctional phosphopantothenoylcysteine decarboxylase/phosphopantothenate--cysteine ligase CoaBC [Candidatus Bathyarchaeota archaeon]
MLTKKKQSPVNHPSKDIVGTKSNRLMDRKILLCVTGSVAAVRSAEIARELMRHGADVFTVMSKNATKIIHPNLLEWATGNPVVTDLTGKIEHVAFAGATPQKVDLVLIAPTTGNTISKISLGIDDTPVTTVASTALGSRTPIVIVPAMHESMYTHHAIQKNIKELKQQNVKFIEPIMTKGKAKLPETSTIVETLLQLITLQKDLHGKYILVTSGSTMEFIDSVRVITNPSSGKMGAAIVNEAVRRGASVTLISNSTSIKPRSRAKIIDVLTTEEMKQAVEIELRGTPYDIMIAVAAVSDWRLPKPRKGKILTSTKRPLKLTLIPTPKIVDGIKKIRPNIFLTIFRAEYNVTDDQLVQSAYERLKKAKADLVIGNDVSRKGVGFGTDTNEVFIIDKTRHAIHVPLSSKRVIANRILDAIKEKCTGT